MSTLPPYPEIQRACPHYPDCFYIHTDPCGSFSEAKQAILVCNKGMTVNEKVVNIKTRKPEEATHVSDGQ